MRGARIRLRVYVGKPLAADDTVIRQADDGTKRWSRKPRDRGVTKEDRP